MNKYEIIYDKKILKQIKRLDNKEKVKIRKWIDDNIQNTSNPRKIGKALSGTLGDLWRYRIGNYRIIVKILDKKLIILVLKIAHRNKVYRQ